MQSIKNVFKKILMNPIISLFVILCLVVLPGKIGQESASFASAIATGIGVDIEDGVFTTYLSYNAPNNNNDFSQNNKVIVGQGADYEETIENISNKIGKEIKFAHTRCVIIGPEIAKTNLTLTIDPIIRTTRLRNSCPIIYSKSPVGDFINFAVTFHKNTGLTATDMVCYDLNSASNRIESNLDNFYKGYLSGSKTSVINCISISEDEKEGMSIDSTSDDSSSSASGSASSSNQQSASYQEKYLVNKGELAVFKEGKLAYILSYKDAVGANWVVGRYYPRTISISNLTTQSLNNATVTYNVVSKTSTQRAEVISGVPYLYFNIDLSLQLDGIVNYGDPSKLIDTDDIEIDDIILKNLNLKIKQQFSSSMQILKSNGADIINTLANFYYDIDKIDGVESRNDVKQLMEKTIYEIKVTAKTN